MKNWLLKKVLDWFSLERIAAFALNRLLDRSNNREKAGRALKVARRIMESAGATVAALERLLGNEVTTERLNELQDSVEKAAVRAWAAGELTPPEARHLKEREDGN